MQANAYALGAILLWATLAPLGVSLQHVPPFLLTGLALSIGSLPTWPLALKDMRNWRVPGATLALGVCGLFGFHFLLFIALRHAPAVEANLVNYLWPLLIVVLAPAVLRGVRLRWQHVFAALLGLAGAALAITAGRTLDGGWAWGYLAALASAFIWAGYSLLTRLVAPFPTAAVGLFGLLSGLLSLLCHAWLEPTASIDAQDWARIAVLGLGPLGVAFLLWDRAFKLGDARQIGVLSYLTPLASTALLMLATGQPFTATIGVATALIVGAAVLGTRAS
jgi:drug/metabolite transporter (DMT)-like permease